jgi:hypothetical protein
MPAMDVRCRVGGGPMMRWRVSALLTMLIPLSGAAARDNGGDFDACMKGQVEVARLAKDFQGEDRIRRLINADLTRAKKEEAEGDADECLEALEHAKKLINGQY